MKLVQWRKLLKEGDVSKMRQLSNWYSTCAVGEKLGLGPELVEGNIPIYTSDVPLIWEAQDATEKIMPLWDLGMTFHRYLQASDLVNASKTLEEIEEY